MTSILDRLLGRRAQPTDTHAGCCGGHHKSGIHGNAADAHADCCGGHGHDAAEGTGGAHEAPVETAGSRS